MTPILQWIVLPACLPFVHFFVYCTLPYSLSHSLTLCIILGLLYESIQTVQQPSRSCARCINEWINIKEKHKSQLCLPRVPTWPHRPTNHVRGLGEKGDGSFVVLARKRERERERGNQCCTISFFVFVIFLFWPVWIILRSFVDVIDLKWKQLRHFIFLANYAGFPWNHGLFTVNRAYL